jgi:hypothetical protein
MAKNGNQTRRKSAQIVRGKAIEAWRCLRTDWRCLSVIEESIDHIYRFGEDSKNISEEGEDGDRPNEPRWEQGDETVPKVDEIAPKAC